MDKIVFYKGEETDIVIERDNLNSSIFSDQYKYGLGLMENMLHATGRVSNIIAFCGDRGEGKTSCMRSFMSIIQNEDSVKQLIKDSSIDIKAFDVLDLIDPAFFDKKHNVIELVLGQMYGRLGFDSSNDCSYSDNVYKQSELLKEFKKVKECLCHLEKERKELYDPFEELSSLTAGVNLKNRIEDLISQYLDYKKKKHLVIAIDDLDLNMTEAYRMAEQIRKYLCVKHCTVLISLKIDQLHRVIESSISNEVSHSDKNPFDYGEMASKYVIKLIPFGNRIIMPHVSELWETKLQICNHGDAIKDAKDLEMVKDVVTEQIFLKTRYLFYNGKGTVSPIVPDNLRDLRLLLGMLLQMQDFENNKKHASNKRIFKAYFFDEWTKKLNQEDRVFVKKLSDFSDLSIINGYVLNFLKERTSYYTTYRYLETEDNLFESKEMYISIGTIMRLIFEIEHSCIDIDLNNLFFFLRSYYSFKLYELYDVVTENEGNIYPKSAEDEEKVLKVDAFFKNVNQLQKLINGSYFYYNPNELVAQNAQFGSRDMRTINGAVLASTMQEIKPLMNQIIEKEKNGEQVEIEDDFKNKFRRCEFFILTTLKNVMYDDKDNPKAEWKFSKPSFLTTYNNRMGSYMFDMLAPFYNITNLRYAYQRFKDIADLYPFALSHDWSILRQMMIKVGEERNQKEFVEGAITNEHQALHILMSDAVIRNTDIHSAIFERLLDNRIKIKETGETKNLLWLNYQSITQIGMHTYSKADAEPYTITFAFLNALIDYLKNEDNEKFEEIMFSGKKNPKEEQNAQFDKVMNVISPILHLPCKGRTVETHIKKLLTDIDVTLPKGYFTNIIDKGATYNNIEQVRKDLVKKGEDLASLLLPLLETKEKAAEEVSQE